MCGIVGYLGNKEAAQILVEGLKKLEYRGYDSAGIAVYNGEEIQVVRKVGKLGELAQEIESKPPKGIVGIGHTRWATHGKPSTENAHPHCDCTGKFVVVHNGIIENYLSLKEKLIAEGHRFSSDTDTEVLAHLLEKFYDGNLVEAVKKVVAMIEGAYAFVAFTEHEPDRLVAVREDSPLIVGLGDGEYFVASDIPALLKHTNRVYILDDGEMADLTRDGVKLMTVTGEPIDKEVFTVDWDPEMAEKGGYEHFMLKEIHEQPEALRRFLVGRLNDESVHLEELNLNPEEIKSYSRIFIVACGTAYHSGLVGKYVIEKLVRIPVEVDIASEFRYRQPLIDESTLVIVVSQSGETADTLAALREAQGRGAKVVAITNVVGSTIAREADEVMYLRVGPEIAVASTKAYTAMVMAFYLFALYLGQIRGTLDTEEIQKAIAALKQIPEQVKWIIENTESEIQKLAEQFTKHENAFFIGRSVDYTVSMEGSLKLKEISYIHAEAYAAGELKHGTLALITNGVPVIALVTQESVYEKMLSNVQEVRAREAWVIAVALEGDEEIKKSAENVLYIPQTMELFTSVLAIIPLQLLAYYVARLRGCDVDQPRNLAKSVTVE
ncbi:glutamine--fructose-6-phosphate aminotransferase [Anoxybacter fermentans]|uniref:Glutamine--fructose-6-phosphate aminotransferase [isomerizing] n=1 Tax=Anoxybacter fermentans TaxID=1323375 RepID=A0A3Q9HPU7_9FIRM|nr:glutamine--fructose-6-phosphate transaminase (isomerizing) [Anoxybacter fermentans]AZR71951.1 glutamine--fructose-6-phosphate aminotransferase [Anoxybacter fermentans]